MWFNFMFPLYEHLNFLVMTTTSHRLACYCLFFLMKYFITCITAIYQIASPPLYSYSCSN